MMQIAESGPLLAPGTCVLCGTGDFDRRWIDTFKSLDFYGRIYFCVPCMIEVHTVIELPDDQRVDRIAELERENVAGNIAIAVLAEFKSSIDRMDLYLAPATEEPPIGKLGAKKSLIEQGL